MVLASNEYRFFLSNIFKVILQPCDCIKTFSGIAAVVLDTIIFIKDQRSFWSSITFMPSNIVLPFPFTNSTTASLISLFAFFKTTTWYSFFCIVFPSKCKHQFTCLKFSTKCFFNSFFYYSSVDTTLTECGYRNTTF